MTLKKQERKAALVEIYKLLAQAGNIAVPVTVARIKVMNMLAEDGIYIIESGK